LRDDDGQDRRQHHAVAEAACAELNRCFRRPDSLTAIADRVGVSVFHLCRVFRSVTGGTIHQHREQLRLRASLQAVLESGEDLLSIGLRLGFSSHSHFTAAFHRRFSITPSALRRLRPTRRGPSAAAALQRR
jgi:AraC-like DNA-binding protein